MFAKLIGCRSHLDSGSLTPKVNQFQVETDQIIGQQWPLLKNWQSVMSVYTYPITKLGDKDAAAAATTRSCSTF